MMGSSLLTTGSFLAAFFAGGVFASGGSGSFLYNVAKLIFSALAAFSLSPSMLERTCCRYSSSSSFPSASPERSVESWETFDRVTRFWP